MDIILKSEVTSSLFESLVENYSKKLLNRAYYLLSNKEDAKDVVQEVFLVAYNKKESLEDIDSIEAWLFGILYHKVADLHKERYKKSTVNINFEYDFDQHGEWRRADVSNAWDEISEHPESLLDNMDFRKSFYDCLDKLPPRWNIVIKLCYLQGKNSNDICNELNISSTNYWKLLQRSRLQLRECIDINWFKL